MLDSMETMDAKYRKTEIRQLEYKVRQAERKLANMVAAHVRELRGE